MYAVDCLAVDPFPQFLEFFFLEIVIEPVCFLAALIFRHGELSITVHAVNQGKNLLGIRGQVWRQRCAGILFFGIIVGRSDGIIVVRVVIFKQIAIYLFGHGRSYLHISFRSAERFVREVGLISLARTGGQSAADFVLQSGHKILVAFVGNNRQHVHVMHYGGIIYSISILVDAKAQAASDFLAAGDCAFTMLQHTHAENVGVIPAFTQGRVRKNKAYRPAAFISEGQ